MGPLLQFIRDMESRNIHFSLKHTRLDPTHDSLMLTLVMPGRIWEIEFFDDGQVEIEKYKSEGLVEATSPEAILAELDELERSD